VVIVVRPAVAGDLHGLTRLDLTYPTDRHLALERSGDPPEHTFTLRWRNRVPAPMAVYATYTTDGLSQALSRADLFLVVEVDQELAGLMIVVVPAWTDAAEITDPGGRYRVPPAGRRPRSRRRDGGVGAREASSLSVGRAAGGQPRGHLVLHVAWLPNQRVQRPASFKPRR